MNELREAAERLRQQYANKADYVYCHKFPGHEMAIDIATVLSDALKKIQPDDDDPVTEEWLESMKTSDVSIMHSGSFMLLSNKSFDLDIEVIEDGCFTRGQVRLLLRALGK